MLTRSKRRALFGTSIPLALWSAILAYLPTSEAARFQCVRKARVLVAWTHLRCHGPDGRFLSICVLSCVQDLSYHLAATAEPQLAVLVQRLPAMRALTKLTLTGRPHPNQSCGILDHSHVSVLALLPNLRILTLFSMVLQTDRLPDTIVQLTLRNCFASDGLRQLTAFAQLLSTCTALTELRIDAEFIDLASLAWIQSRQKTLSQLTLVAPISDLELCKTVASLSALRALSLTSFLVEGHNLGELPTGLERLRLCTTTRLSGDNFGRLQHLQLLRSLYLCEMLVSCVQVRALQPLSALTFLSLFRCTGIHWNEITWSALPRSLERLDLSCSEASLEVKYESVASLEQDVSTAHENLREIYIPAACCCAPAREVAWIRQGRLAVVRGATWGPADDSATFPVFGI